MKSRRLLSLATLGALLAAASLSQDPPKPPDPHEGAAESKKPEKEKPAEEKKWDVEAPPYPMPIAAALDTDEGTWMSVDVSADGKEIIFDLLGDIYAMPFSGGDARPLTSGVAWDMQPRFSPDGRRIAFTSDRSGGDNVWIMDRDGGNSVQVTKENFRLPNSPVWTPDGDFIAARKHFTSTRSLGAGEIWLYHRSGGEGLQMTKRANDQKDVGEPAFSPDGRYLYYSQDVTPGKVFEYNKDPYGQIYVIQRLDRVRGEIQRFVAGSGGSIRPTPSPDGKRLAFIRRVGLKTVLYAKDLDSGRERAIADGLDRDMQETWAVHGVYPGMAWTPDSRSVVFWAGGKIRRADIGTREVSVIPFRVRSTRKMAKAVRFSVPLGPERFPVKMLRFVQVSPVGGQVLYEALGHIYVRDLPEGAPRRLTRQTDHRELYPSYSRDGRFIVYATWDDEQAGSIRVAPARGGEGRVVTEEPGHYVEPVFSPDGSRIVFRRVRGGFTRTPLWSGVPGLYFTPASGGKPVWIVKEGILPQFGSGNDRVYFMKSEEKEDSDEEKRVFMSVDLDGSDERAHLVSESATSSGFRRTRSGSPSAKASKRSSPPSWVRERGSRSARRRKRSPSRASRRTPGSTCTGRETGAVSTGPWGRSFSRERSKRPSPSSKARRRSSRTRRPKERRSGSRQPSRRPRGVSPWSGRGSLR